MSSSQAHLARIPVGFRLRIWSEVISHEKTIYFYEPGSEGHTKPVTLPRGSWNILQVCRQFREVLQHHPDLVIGEARGKDGNMLRIPCRKTIQPGLDAVYVDSNGLGCFCSGLRRHESRLKAFEKEHSEARRRAEPEPAMPGDLKRPLEFFATIECISLPYRCISHHGPRVDFLFRSLPSSLLKTNRFSIVFGPTWTRPKSTAPSRNKTQHVVEGRRPDGNKQHDVAEQDAERLTCVEPPVRLEQIDTRVELDVEVDDSPLDLEAELLFDLQVGINKHPGYEQDRRMNLEAWPDLVWQFIDFDWVRMAQPVGFVDAAESKKRKRGQTGEAENVPTKWIRPR